MKHLLTVFLITLGLAASAPAQGLGIDASTAAYWREVRSWGGSAPSATPLARTVQLRIYLGQQGLWSSTRAYLLKSAYNTGTGSAVIGFGGLTSNNITLVNSPTWGADGVTFASASSQSAAVSDFLGGAVDLTVFTRLAFASATPTTIETIVSQYNPTGNQRSVLLNYRGTSTGDPLLLARSTDGTATGAELYVQTTPTPTTADQTIVAQWLDGAGRNLWINKTASALTLSGGDPETSRFDTADDVEFSAGLNATVRGYIFVETTITTAQREWLTDWLNAL